MIREDYSRYKFLKEALQAKEGGPLSPSTQVCPMSAGSTPSPGQAADECVAGAAAAPRAQPAASRGWGAARGREPLGY